MIEYDRSPLDKKSIRKINADFPYRATELEYREWLEGGGVSD